MICLCAPLVLLGALEFGLRLAGYGYATDVATLQPLDGTPRYSQNTKLGWLFFPRYLARELDPFAFEADKSPDTYRVFVLGASAAQGFPDPLSSVSRILQVILEDAYDGRRFEVINVGMTAVNSHVVRHIAESCADFEPDLMVVYLGNNELIGPFGPGTTSDGMPPSLASIRTRIALRATKTGQLLQSVASALTDTLVERAAWGGMKMYLDHQVTHDAKAREVVYDSFSRNLRDICRSGIEAGARVVLSNVASNLKDSPPFASQHRHGLSDDDRGAWDALFQAGIEHEEAGRYAEALRAYLAAARLDDHYAALPFRIGRCYEALGAFTEARDRYVQARERDTLPFRAGDEINRAIKVVAGNMRSDGVYFVDAVKALEVSSPRGIPGRELFFEHVHLRFEGNYVLACSLLMGIETALPDEVKKLRSSRPLLSLAACAERLVYTDLERYHSTRKIISLMKRPPFEGLPYQDSLLARLEGEASAIEATIQPTLQALLPRYKAMTQRYPEDWQLRWRVADYADRYFKNPVLAAVQAETVLKSVRYPAAYLLLMHMAIREGRFEDAEAYAQTLVAMRPARADHYFDLGEIAMKQAAYEKAIKHFSKGLRIQPGAESIVVYTYLSELYESVGRPEKAIDVLQEGISHDPRGHAVKAYVRLGLLLAEHGEAEEAIGVFRKTFSLFPSDTIVQRDAVRGVLESMGEAELAEQLSTEPAASP